MYFLGFQRTTCWLCPVVTPYAIKLSEEAYPELWQKISGCEFEAFGNDGDKNTIY